MFPTDWFFLTISLVLLGLSFVSIGPSFGRLWLRYSPELLFSAVGAISVVILAWERIASSRSVQLRQLMERVYLDGEEHRPYQTKIEPCNTLRVMCNDVRTNVGLASFFPETVQKAILVLKDNGRFHYFDYLYPKKVMTDLEKLHDQITEYANDYDELERCINDFVKNEPRPAFPQDRIRSIVIGGIAATRIDEELSTVAPDIRQKVTEFIEKLRQESSYVARLKNGIWKTEIMLCFRPRFSSIGPGYTSRALHQTHRSPIRRQPTITYHRPIEYGIFWILTPYRTTRLAPTSSTPSWHRFHDQATTHHLYLDPLAF
jgi:hypothetical protein